MTPVQNLIATIQGYPDKDVLFDHELRNILVEALCIIDERLCELLQANHKLHAENAWLAADNALMARQRDVKIVPLRAIRRGDGGSAA